MPAAVKTNAFLLGEATLMIAPYSAPVSVFDLTPDDHSVGMVRGVTLTKENDEVELRKGVRQLLVDSQESNVRVNLSAEVFEYSAQNVLYSLGRATTAVAPKRGKLAAAANGAASTITVVSDPLPGEASTGISAAGDIPEGATVMIQRPDDETDYVLAVRVTDDTVENSGEFTVTVAIPTGMSFPAGSKVWVVNELSVGSTTPMDFFKVKLVSTLSNNGRPVQFVVPKVKIVRGFQFNFDEGNYTSMPFELRPYFLSAAEATGRLAEIGTNKLVHGFLA